MMVLHVVGKITNEKTHYWSKVFDPSVLLDNNYSLVANDDDGLILKLI